MGRFFMNQENAYKTAIEGRSVHLQSYNHWMNMYAIINGALFAGLNNFYCHAVMKTLITLLGFLAGWFWFFSVCGFYKWIISWISVVSYHEQKLASEQDTEIDSGKTDKVYIYRLFCPIKFKFCNPFMNFRNLSMRPFSTQKLTRNLAFCIAIIWTILFLGNIQQIREPLFSFFSSNGFVIGTGLIMFILSFTPLFREDLTKSHKILEISKDPDDVNPFKYKLQ